MKKILWKNLQCRQTGYSSKCVIFEFRNEKKVKLTWGLTEKISNIASFSWSAVFDWLLMLGEFCNKKTVEVF